MSFRKKIIMVNAFIIIVFVALLTYSSIRIVQDSSVGQFNQIKESITNYNKGLLQTFVRAQSLSLNKEVDLIREAVEHLATDFMQIDRNQDDKDSKLIERLIYVNQNLKPFINEVTSVNFVEKTETEVKSGRIVTLNTQLEFDDLFQYRNFYIGKSYSNELLIDFSLFVPLKKIPNKVLRFRLNLDYFASSLAFDNMVEGLQYRYFIVDSRGKLVASNLKQDALALLTHTINKRRELESVSTYILSHDIGSLSVELILGAYDVTFIKNYKTGWRLILVTPESVVGSNYLTTKELLLSSDSALVKKFILISLIFLTVFVSLNSVITNEMFLPINKLIHQAQSLKNRDFDEATNIILCNGSEIEQLSRAYSEAGTQIQLMLENLEEKVSQRTILYESAAQQASEANEQKSNLISNVSHEIRTPLNAIIGYTHMLLSTSMLDRNSREIRGISNASNTILRIVNDLLDYERAHASGYVLYPKDTLVSDIVDHIKITFEPMALAKGLSLSVSSDLEGGESVYVDELRLKQCISNIVVNAMKFTNIGKVDVRCLQTKDHFIITVADTGIGISQDKLTHIFRGFEQINHEDQQSGFGLGLAITKQIVQLMNGELTVASELGAGTVFTVALPNEKGAMYICSEHSCQQTMFEQANKLALSDNSFNDVRVLVVDDVEYNREILEFLLAQLGCTCVQAVNGVDALELARNSDFDVVFTDISMPKMNGIQLSEELYKVEPLLPVIAVTARATLKEKARMERFFKCYLTKPLDREDLKNKLACALNLGQCV
ncbi:ATP-binding protein [Vibrio coralliirubri]|uniref:ATP-binding protein n=1 Tax=Vibrio coralliirubri TaxID=1516159 RepID=UPI000A38E96A|nr:ATP-binding protein [Vibrio coralliirubri]